MKIFTYMLFFIYNLFVMGWGGFGTWTERMGKKGVVFPFEF